MRKVFTLALLLFAFFTASAQHKTIDSLRKLIATTKEDSGRVILLNKLSGIYVNSKPDSAMLLSQEAIQLSKATLFQKGEAIALNIQGNVFNATGNYPKALNRYLSSIKIGEQIGDRVIQLKAFGNIGNVYTNEGDYRGAVVYMLRCLQLARELRSKRIIEVTIANLGDAYEKLNILDSALLYTRQSLPLAEEIKDIDLIGNSINNLGNIYLKIHMPDTALHYYRKAMPYWKKVGDDDGICESTLGMAQIFKQLGKLDSSLYYARQSIAAGWRGGFTVRVLNASQFLTSYFKQQGRADSAFRYLEVSVAAKDSLFSQEKTREIQNLNFAERQRQQDIQEKEVAYKTSIRFYLLLAMIAFLVLMAFVFWRISKQRQKANTLLQNQNAEIEKQKQSVETALGELKTTQNRLLQSAKMASLGELTAGIAHEIQNPLNFVNNFSDVNDEMLTELKEALKTGNMQEALTIANDVQENEKKIRHHGKRADFIVKGMLEHSRTSTGERQATNINVLADEFLKLSYHGLRAKDKNFNSELVTNFDTSLPRINIVQQDIGRVLINLFSNAFYAVNQKAKTVGSDYKPTVEVSTASQNGSILIKVRDNGTGIPDAVKDKIMQPFFTTKPTGEGTGLGLSLSYDIVVKGHGGSIDVDTKEGEFTEFVVHLPS